MIGYIRVSDSRKADGESQREAIKAYASTNNLEISGWVEEHVSTTETDLGDRKLSSLITSRQRIIVSDITRLGRNNEFHLAYNDTVISSKNVENAEILFTVIGQSFASAVEAQKRSERAKAGHANVRLKGYHRAARKDRK